MKNRVLSDTIEVIFNESESSKLKFIRFLVDYFIENHITEVVCDYEDIKEK